MSLFAPYIPMDRRIAILAGIDLPDRAEGAVLFADISGFTKLTDSLVEAFGRKRGAEEILPLLNRIYDAIIRAVHLYGGSVIYFSGDAVTCWFDGDNGLRAATAATEMQESMLAFESIRMTGGFQASIRLKVAIASGQVRRFVVGSPDYMCIDALAGRLVDLVAQGERLASSGEILLADAAARSAAGQVGIGEWRTGKDGAKYGVVEHLVVPAIPVPWGQDLELPDELASIFVQPAVANRLRSGLGHYLAEIRPATALFLKFGGLNYDDDLAGEKLNQYVKWIQKIVDRYSGVILQLTIGDKGAYFYMGFGVPVAHTDDTARAVAAAIALRNVPAELSFISDVKIGLAHGQMRTGAYGGEMRLTYGVMGSQVNRAARLMSLAPPGEIYFDKTVHSAVASRWETEPVHISDGTRQQITNLPAEIYRLAGERLKTQRSQEEIRRLVGRRAELSRLAEVLERASAGRTSLMFVSGEAGIGKSRLVAAAAGSARESGFLVLEGAGSSTEQQTVYWPWREILAQFFGWKQDDSQEDRLRLISELAGSITAANAARLPLLNDIAYLNMPENDLTAGFSGQLRQDNLVLLIADLIRVRAKYQPLLLIFEDVHWIDAPSWDLSIRIAEILTGREEPAAFVWVSRPLEDDPRQMARLDAIWSMEEVEVLDLRAMPAGDIRSFIASELGVPPGAVPEKLLELVRTKSEGNPLYAREMLLNLKERGMILFAGEDAESSWQLTEEFSQASSTLPDTLQGLILARIDRLSFEMQAVLKVASVIGRSFAAETLRNVLGVYHEIHPARLGEHLTGLVVADMIQPEAAGGYMFSHVLTRDTAYQTLLSAQRKQLHHAIANWYEDTYAPEARAPHYAALAHHYGHAEVEDLEYRYVGLAADQAYARYANREALEYWKRALELAPSPEERIELHLKREEVHDVIGDRSGQQAELQKLILLTSQLSSYEREAELAVRYSKYEQLMGNYHQAGSWAERVIVLGRDLDARRIFAAGSHLKGKILLQQGAYEEAEVYFKSALDAFEKLDIGSQIANVFADYGVLETYRGDFDAAVPYFERAILLHQEAGNRREAARSLANLGSANALLGNLARAIETYHDAYRINLEIGERRAAHIAQGNLGIMYRSVGDYRSARQNLNEALITSREIGDRRKEANWLGSLGEVSLSLGRFNEALASFEEALRISQEIGNRAGQAQWLTRLGDVSRLMMHYPEARKWVEMGLVLNEEIGDRSEIGGSLISLGRIKLDEGLWEEAFSLLEGGYEIRRQLGQDRFAWSVLPWMAIAALKQGHNEMASSLAGYFIAGWKDQTEQQRMETDPEALYAGYRVLEAQGDPDANELIQAARRIILDRAAKIDDPEMRSEYLIAVPAYQAIYLADEGEITPS